jgi:hypothetical protein
MELVLEAILDLVARAGIELFGEQVGDVVRTADLEADDVVDLERSRRPPAM